MLNQQSVYSCTNKTKNATSNAKRSSVELTKISGQKTFLPDNNQKEPGDFEVPMDKYKKNSLYRDKINRKFDFPTEPLYKYNKARRKKIIENIDKFYEKVRIKRIERTNFLCGFNIEKDISTSQQMTISQILLDKQKCVQQIIDAPLCQNVVNHILSLPKFFITKKMNAFDFDANIDGLMTKTYFVKNQYLFASLCEDFGYLTYILSSCYQYMGDHTENENVKNFYKKDCTPNSKNMINMKFDIHVLLKGIEPVFLGRYDMVKDDKSHIQMFAGGNILEQPQMILGPHFHKYSEKMVTIYPSKVYHQDAVKAPKFCSSADLEKYYFKQFNCHTPVTDFELNDNDLLGKYINKIKTVLSFYNIKNIIDSQNKITKYLQEIPSLCDNNFDKIVF
ncbi:MAG: hypothetical protein RR140_01450 [Clostridia bacterium]